MPLLPVESGQIPIPGSARALAESGTEPQPGVPMAPIGPRGPQGPTGPAGGPSPSDLAQSAWYIDPVHGNDTNDGATPGTAIRTAAQYFTRTGPLRDVLGPIVLRLLGDLPATDPLVLSNFYRAPNATVTVVDGAPNVLASGTLTGAIAFNSKAAPSGQLQVVTDASRASWAALIGKIFKITSGAAAGATATIIADLGGGSASVSVVGRASSGNPTGYTAVAVVGNEAYQVLERRNIGQLVIHDLNPFAYPFDQSPIVPALTIVGCKLPPGPLATQSGFTLDVGSLVADDCEITGIVVAPGGRLFANNCYSSSASGGLVTFIGNVATTYGWFDGTTFLLAPGGTYSTTISIFHACALFMANGGVFEAHHEIGIYNSSSFLTVRDGGKIIIRHGLFGSGNTNSVFLIEPGGVAMTEAVTGTGDFVITGTGVGYQDIKMGAAGAQTSLPAMDRSTYTLTALRALTFANYFTSVASGGFGQNIFDPAQPTTAMMATGN